MVDRLGVHAPYKAEAIGDLRSMRQQFAQARA